MEVETGKTFIFGGVLIGLNHGSTINHSNILSCKLSGHLWVD